MGAALKTIDAYLAGLPEQSRGRLEAIRRRIAAAAPEAVEAVKYGMPTASIGGRNILYYAAWKTHIGLYPIYRGSPEFEAAIAPYRDKKDAVRLPLDAPMPLHIVDLILSARLETMRAPAESRS